VNELQTTLPDIDGEFRSEEESGFGCRECGYPLLIGSASCPKCKRRFIVLTPSLHILARSKHEKKMEALGLIFTDRRTLGNIRDIRRSSASHYPE
jgi:hypothetical protein